MKKILLSLSICSFVFLLLSHFYEVSQWQQASLNNLTASIQSENPSLASVRTYQADFRKMKEDNIASSLMDFCQNEKIALLTTKMESRDFYYVTYTTRLFLPDSIDPEILKLSGINGLFGLNGNISASTLPEGDQKQINMLNGFLNTASDDQTMIVPFFSFLSGNQETEPVDEYPVTVIAENEQSLNRLMEYFPDYFEEQDSSIVSVGYGFVASAKQILNEFWVSPFLILYLVSTLLVFTAWIVMKRKEISIHKLNGIDTWTTFRRIFSKDLLWFGLCIPCLSLPATLFILMRFPASSIQAFYLKTGLPFLCIHLISVGLMVIEGLLSIQWMKLSLKSTSNKASTNLMLSLCLGCLFCTAILILPASQSIQACLTNLRDLYILESHKSVFTGYLTDSFWNTQKTEDSETTSIETIANDIEVMTKWNQFLEEHDGIYEDFSLMEFTFSNELHEMGQPFVQVNANYLKDYQIVLEDGTMLNLDQYPAEFPLILIPEGRVAELKENDQFRMMCQAGQKLYVKDGIRLYPHLVSDQNVSQIPYQDPVICVSQPPTNYGQSYRFIPVEGEQTEQEVQEFLQANDLEGILNYSLNTLNYTNTKNSVTISLLQNGLVMLIYLLCLGVMLKSLLQIWLASDQKLIAVQYHLGLSWFKRYQVWFAIGILMCLCVLLVLLLKKASIKTIVAGSLTYLLLFIAISWTTIRKFEKGRIHRILKGEQSL